MKLSDSIKNRALNNGRQWCLSKTNVFLVHTVFQDYLFKKTVISLHNCNKIILVTDLDKYRSSSVQESFDVIYVKDSTKGILRGSWPAIRRAIERIDEIVGDSHFNLYYSQIEYPLANALVSKYINRATLINYPEGICNILPPSYNIVDLIWRFIKSIFGRIYSARFWVFNGGIDGARYADIVIRISGLNTIGCAKNKVISYINIPRKTIQPNCNRLLILGTVAEEGITVESVKKIVNKYLLEWRTKTQLYFKPHPRESGELTEIFKIYGFNVLDKEINSEDLVELIRPSIIVGFGSSSLINIRLIYGESLMLKSIITSQMYEVDKSRNEGLRKIFNSLNIEYIVT